MRAVLAGLALLVSLGCTPGTDRAGGPAGEPTATSATGSPSAATTVTPSPSSSAPSPAAVTVLTVPPKFRGGFRTPSGNIRCELSDGFVRCDATDRPWREVPENDCGGTAEWRTRLVLDERGAVLRGECGYDPPAGGPPLAYGTRLDAGRTRCYSETRGLTCWTAGTRHGFFVSRAAYRLTARPPAEAAAATRAPQPRSRVITAPRGFRGSFRTTGYGVVCDIDDTGVHCLGLGTRWAPPPPTEPCTDGDRSTEFLLRDDGRGRAFTGCRTDSLAAEFELAAGHAVQVGRVRCDARRADLECRNAATGHGFVVSEQRFRGY